MVDVDNLINFGALQLVNFVVNCDQLIQICSAPVLPACNSCNLCQHLFVNVYLYILISPPEKRVIYRRSEEHTSELQSRGHLVCRLLLEKTNHMTVLKI